MQIALFATLHRPHALQIVRRTVAAVEAYGHTVRMAGLLATRTDCPQCAVADEAVIREADLAIAIGGDGTMLGAVRAAAPHRVPVLGVNAGALGFLTEISPEDLDGCLTRVLTGAYTLEPRMMLRACIYRGETLQGDQLALNDIVIRQGSRGRLIHLDVMVAGHQLGHFGADGLILCSPTGSTAYGLSAGGPIVHPQTSVMVLVPICPHSLSFRPMVIPATDPIEILCESNPHGDEMMVSADGQDPITVLSGDRIVIQPAEQQALLVKLGLFSFYERLREKLQWGGG